jgi:hypothetical protein
MQRRVRATRAFTDHAFLLRRILARVDGITADIDITQRRADRPFVKA